MRYGFFLGFLAVGILALKKPEKDEFYKPPRGFQDRPLGDILKSRQTPGPIQSYLATIDAITWQLLIRSEDSFGKPNAIVATLLEPRDADPTKVLSYQPFQNSALITCCPSYAMLVPSFDTLHMQVELSFIAMALFMKWYVVIPDYQGPKSAFPVANQSAFAVLNVMRGVQTFLNQSTSFAMFGYSGGAFASAWASIKHPKYAPELNIVGAAVGGLVSNISALVECVDGGPYAGLVLSVLNGCSNEYPEFRLALRKYGMFLKNYCLMSAAAHYFGTSFNRDIYRNFSRDAVITSIFKKNSLMGDGKPVPKMPIFIYHSAINEMIPAAEIRKVFDYWCANGVIVEFAEDESYNHIVEAFAGVPASMMWLKKRFDGVKSKGKCIYTWRPSNFLYPGTRRFIKSKLKRSLEIFLSKLNVFESFTTFTDTIVTE
ncbi:uncharacterized protein LODBEIA_P39460 [Lodderomyces beijingensis]|uniref:Triacylglycerol lipase n=1 Tax=Lodderomyces beijingensis TaxID=1775926 RepID=A0ABP0ZTX5_9ASCO